MDTKYNLLLDTDSYKECHWNQYPEGTEVIYSYFESRQGADYDETVFFGLQYLIKKYLIGVVVTQEKIDEARVLLSNHFGSPDMFNLEGWEYILKEHGGKLPIKIKAVPEGTRVGVSNVLMTVENTDPKCFWLTNFLETMLSRVWYPCTVATRSRYIRDIIEEAFETTGANPASVPFMLHDFGSRGVSSHESAGLGGMAHLVNFLGTDTIHAMQYALRYYNANPEVVGFSVPATEHSVMTIKGRQGEMKVFERLLKKYPTGILSVVSDSYDIDNFISNYASVYKDEILAREGKVVFRPDSGGPVSMVLNVLDRLEEVFGSIRNEAGFKNPNKKVGVIFGDGLEADTIASILRALVQNEWSTDSCIFGCGGGLLQKVNRDTQRFAFKCSAAKINGEWRDVYKDPKTGNKSDQFFKASKKGRLVLVKTSVGYQTLQRDKLPHPVGDQLEPVFINGDLVREYSLGEIRERSVK